MSDVHNVNRVPGKKTGITQENVLRLSTWLGVNAERLMKECPNFIDAARQASESLGCYVPEGALRRVMKFANVTWEARRPSGNYHTKIKQEMMGEMQNLRDKLGDMVKEVETQVHQVAADVAILRRLIHHLFQSLAAPYPTWYTPPITPRVAVVNKV